MQIITPQQILVPKKVYIGDTAELRCTFNSPNPLLQKLTANGVAELPLVSHTAEDSDTNTDFAVPHKDYEIQKLTLSPAGVNYYQFTVTFVPWKTGELQLPPMEIEGSELILEFQPLQIVSLISTDPANATTLHNSAAPLLLPGTTYKLYGSLTALIIALIVIIRLIVKRKKLIFYINQKRLLKKYKKNKKKTLKLLKQAEHTVRNECVKTGATNIDQRIAEKLQKIMRNYLEVRFDYPFTHAVTSEMMNGWQTATGGLLSDAKLEAFGEITGSFIRTDYIRYSKNAAFEPDEIKQTVEKLTYQIEVLEKDDS